MDVRASEPMFVFISHLTVPEADGPELERHFRERSRLVDGFPGFLYLQLLRPQAGDATHTFLTAWESREAFRRYMGSEEHAVSAELAGAPQSVTPDSPFFDPVAGLRLSDLTTRLRYLAFTDGKIAASRRMLSAASLWWTNITSARS